MVLRDYLYGLATDKNNGLIASGIKAFLYVFSLIYGLSVVFLAFFYRLKPYRLNCKVISVGNITVGGTGKTSLVEAIARYLQAKGHKVAILSRGYKRRTLSSQASDDSYENMGDEPFMLSRRLGNIPVIVDKDRVQGAKKAIGRFGADTVILDDGLQQWRIKKDLEVVTIDATQPFGNRRLLPRGILREPLSALQRADILVLTKTNLAGDIQGARDLLARISPRSLLVESAHAAEGFLDLKGGNILAPDSLKGKAAGLFSGIADPASFERLVRALGVNTVFSLSFPDHHHYSRQDLQDIVHRAGSEKVDTLITTEKDASRLTGLRIEDPGVRIIFLRITLKVSDEQRLYNRILGLYPA